MFRYGLVNEDAIVKKIQNNELHCILSNIRKHHIADYHAVDIFILDATEKHFISRSPHAQRITAAYCHESFV